MVNRLNIQSFKQVNLSVGLFCLFILSSCNSNNPIIASVGDSDLTESELYSMLSNEGVSSTDSTQYYLAIDRWIENEAFLQSLQNADEEEYLKIKSRASFYAGTLARFFIEENQLRNELDTIVQIEEIETYYNEHKQEFILHDYIVKALYLKIPKEIDFKSDNVHRSFLLKNDKDLSEINSYAKLYAENYYFNDSTWIFFNDVAKEIPITKYNVDNIVLNRSKTYFSDDNFTYFLNIIDFKLKNEAPPIDFLKDKIKSTILTHRMHELKIENESKLIQRIKDENEINISL